ncbi:hypothetical protein PsorP6_003739 [Peronosclerospora sorghi]|uniref:Uncharacterized protein n=1 Tax=Peronosclerospora sorghi TaxID=230839 RepID=A0ACC0VKA3_9STRA|nr:hypothetical protein PsorP6_019206 [Peronosclerospora sorghi]KAI9906795.1 hypothetical protein PsorP6_003739 [Peronosclerospora sorghi]
MGKKSKPTKVAPVPGFFGHVVRPGHPLKWENEVEDFILQLNSAALGADATQGRSTLFVVAKTSKIAICSLTLGVTDQWNLSQTFTPMDGKIEFVAEGPNAVHITGFIEANKEENDDGYEYDNFGDNGDSEDEMMVFGGDLSSNEDEDEEEKELNDEDDLERFEVVEERLHKDETVSNKMTPKKEECKIETKKQEISKEENNKKNKEIETKSPDEPASVSEKGDAAGAEVEKKTDEANDKKKAKATKLAEKEKKTAEKLAEINAANPKKKKRAAPVESVEVPKKAKTAKRVHKGVTIEDIAVGKGRPVRRGHKVQILYRGCLMNGKQFDANQNRKKPFTFRHGIGDVIKGMDIGIEGMHVGSKRTITIPSRLGYGREGSPPAIPGNSDLIFEIEVVNA